MIELKNLVKLYGAVRAVDDVNLTIVEGESLGLVGESGSGKTTLARMILGLIEPTSGSILFEPINGSITSNNVRAFRRQCQIVFQDPQTSLNPRIKIGAAIEEPLLIHGLKGEAKNMLELVKLPVSYASRYPHQLSGGERQRVGIARALALKPKFLILDEPVSSLDVLIQVEILQLLKELKTQLGLTYLFIAHDLSVIGFMCDRIAVMENGRIVEIGAKEQILKSPAQDYTKRLLASVLAV